MTLPFFFIILCLVDMCQVLLYSIIERMLLEKKSLEDYFRKLTGKSFDKEFDGFICRDNFGKLISPNYVTGRFHYVTTKNGLCHLRFHDLRHSCASLLLANDVPMKAIQE